MLFFIDKYFNIDKEDKGRFSINPLMSINTKYNDNPLMFSKLSNKLTPKQVDFVMSFFQRVKCINNEYNSIYKKSINLYDEEIEVFALSSYKPKTLYLKKSDIIVDHLDSYFVSTCMFCDEYFQLAKDEFVSILKIIDRVTGYKKNDKGALANEYQISVKIYNNIKGQNDLLLGG